MPRKTADIMESRAGLGGRRLMTARGLAFAAGCTALVFLLSVPVFAQRVVGNKTIPNVIVDYSVLDQLGPAPNLPQLLIPRARGAAQPDNLGRTLPALNGRRFPTVPGVSAEPASGRIVLKRPSTVKKTRKPRRTAKKRPRRKTTVAEQVPAPAKPVPAPPRAKVSVAKLPPPPKITPAPKPMMTASKPAPAPPAPAATSMRDLPAKTPSKPLPLTEKTPPPPPAIARVPAPVIKAPPVPSAPAPMPAAQPEPKQQTASLPPAEPSLGPGRSLLLLFDSGSAKLKREATRKLKSVAEAVAKNDKLRLQLLAYADGTSQSASKSRRLSLSRALAARSYLISQGVRSTRIDVRALGNKTEGGPADRIDVIVTKR